MTKKLEKKHLLAIRWFHWINFPLLFLMIWSGLLIYWANAVYGIKLFGYEIFHFFPAGFYEPLGIPKRLAEGISLHFFLMWFFTINGILYVGYVIISGEWRSLLPVPGSFKRAFQVMLHDLHLRKELPPQGKYNDAQRIAYSGVLLLGIGAVVSGLAIYKPTQVWWLTALFGGYQWARWFHFWIMILFVLFFAVHIIQVAIAGWSNFRSMITGYEIIETNEKLSETTGTTEKGVKI